MKKQIRTMVLFLIQNNFPFFGLDSARFKNKPIIKETADEVKNAIEYEDSSLRTFINKFD